MSRGAVGGGYGGGGDFAVGAKCRVRGRWVGGAILGRGRQISGCLHFFKLNKKMMTYFINYVKIDKNKF